MATVQEQAPLTTPSTKRARKALAAILKSFKVPTRELIRAWLLKQDGKAVDTYCIVDVVREWRDSLVDKAKLNTIDNLLHNMTVEELTRVRRRVVTELQVRVLQAARVTKRGAK